MAFTNLLAAVYPVGSLYLSTSATSPANIIGGTWTQIKGAVLGFTGSNSFSGAASYGGDKKVILKHLPSGYIEFRTITLDDNNLVLTTSGIFSKEYIDWDGNHGAAQNAAWDNNYRRERVVLDGGGRTSFPTTLRFMDGTELLNLLGGE